MVSHGGFLFYLFNLFWAALGLSCGMCVPELTGSVGAVHGLSCPMACGIFLPQPGTETHPLLWNADS